MLPVLATGSARWTQRWVFRWCRARSSGELLELFHLRFRRLCNTCMLTTTLLGAVWSSCSPDFGVAGVSGRLGQVDPKVSQRKVLFAVKRETLELLFCNLAGYAIHAFSTGNRQQCGDFMRRRLHCMWWHCPLQAKCACGQDCATVLAEAWNPHAAAALLEPRPMTSDDL